MSAIRSWLRTLPAALWTLHHRKVAFQNRGAVYAAARAIKRIQSVLGMPTGQGPRAVGLAGITVEDIDFFEARFDRKEWRGDGPAALRALADLIQGAATLGSKIADPVLKRVEYVVQLKKPRPIKPREPYPAAMMAVIRKAARREFLALVLRMYRGRQLSVGGKTHFAPIQMLASQPGLPSMGLPSRDQALAMGFAKRRGKAMRNRVLGLLFPSPQDLSCLLILLG